MPTRHLGGGTLMWGAHPHAQFICWPPTQAQFTLSAHTGVMTSTIRTTCARCGTQEMPVAEVKLSLTLEGDDLRNVLDFTCPSCGLAVRQRVNERATRLLAGAGITLVASPQTSPTIESTRGSSSS